jgi:hypothetical protein
VCLAHRFLWLCGHGRPLVGYNMKESICYAGPEMDRPIFRANEYYERKMMQQAVPDEALLFVLQPWRADGGDGFFFILVCSRPKLLGEICARRRMTVSSPSARHRSVGRYIVDWPDNTRAYQSLGHTRTLTFYLFIVHCRRFMNSLK